MTWREGLAAFLLPRCTRCRRPLWPWQSTMVDTGGELHTTCFLARELECLSARRRRAV